MSHTSSTCTNDRYKDIEKLLLKYISEEQCLPNHEDCSDYISTFSFFIYNTDPDYEYNIPFLNEEHNKFRSFLCNAKAQYKEMKDIISELFPQGKDSVLWRQLVFTENEFILSLNEFLEIRFNKMIEPQISFCHPLSIDRGNREPSEYVYIFYNNAKQECFKQCEKDKMINNIKSTIAESFMSTIKKGAKKICLYILQSRNEY